MRPRPPLLIAAAAWTGVGLAAVWWPPAATLWNAFGVALAAAALADLWLLARTHIPLVQRQAPRNLPQGAWSPVQLRITNPHRRALRLDCHDLHPAGFDVRGQPCRVDLPPLGEARLDYRLRPPRRGRFAFAGCELALMSPFGLWRRLRRAPLTGEARVYPNFAEVSRYTLLAANDQLAGLGVRRLRRRGGGGEFHQLREYRVGDSLRQVDWKATSRLRKLIAREYQDERDQRLVFLLDCGRRMRHLDAAGRGHLDEALNALLLLAWVAVHQGDAVGLLTFGGPERWFAPRKDPDTVARLLQMMFDLEAGLGAADPLAAARGLLQRQSRRALVVLVTNSRDEDQPELGAAVRLLRRRHLVVVADLRESILDDSLGAPIDDREAAQRFLAVQSYLEDRRRHHEQLQHQGARVLDLLPRQLPVALVNQYFAIKRAGLL